MEGQKIRNHIFKLLGGAGKCQPTSLYPIKIAFESNSEIHASQEKKRRTISEIKEIYKECSLGQGKNKRVLRNSSTLATSWKELTHWKRPWCWEGLGAGGEGDDRRWDGWMASPTRWACVWVNSRSWWWTGRPGVLRFMGSQRLGHDWATELNWII